jgi:hypothetical protein
MRVSYLDILYRRHRDKVDLQVHRDYDVQQYSWSDYPFFGQRLTILKRAYESLTEAEKEEIQQELTEVKEQGWDAETQFMYVPLPSHAVPLRIPCRSYYVPLHRSDTLTESPQSMAVTECISSAGIRTERWE